MASLDFFSIQKESILLKMFFSLILWLSHAQASLLHCSETSSVPAFETDCTKDNWESEHSLSLVSLERTLTCFVLAG